MLSNGAPIDYQAAEQLRKNAAGLMTCVGDTLFFYEGGFWRPMSDRILRGRAQKILRLFWSSGDPKGFRYGSNVQVRHTVASFKTLLGQGQLLAGEEQPRVIVFSNGSYDPLSGRLGAHDPAHGATYGLAFPFLEGSACPPELQTVIDRCFPPGAKSVIRAIIRWVADPTIRYGECFHLLGPTGSGKGLLIDFLRSLLPPDLNGDLISPARISDPEKIHQYILGRRLVAFPDCPTSIRERMSWNTFYELVENKLVTTRKLYAGEAERSRRMNCRFILASIAPIQSLDGTDGFQRRVRTLCTLPRHGDIDTTLATELQSESGRHDQIRGEAVSWALCMPREEVVAVLDGRDPEGLLREAAQEVAVASDSVSSWADACLVPIEGPDGPNKLVTDQDWLVMFDVYKAWCKYTCTSGSPLAYFQGQLRRVLGPKRCLPRGKAPMTPGSAGEASRRINLPRVDAGFQLRPGLSRGKDYFNPLHLGSGGLKALEALPGASRQAASAGG